MRIALPLLLLAASVARAGDDAPPPLPLFKHDLQQVLPVTTPDGESFTAERTLSLRPGDKPSQGTVWLLCSKRNVSYQGKRYPDTHGAFKGVYQLFRTPDPDTFLLKIGVTRYYRASATGSDLEWELQTNFEATGAAIEVLVDDLFLRQEPVQLSIQRAFFVDEWGQETQKVRRADTLKEKLFGGKELQVSNLEFAKLGDTWRLKRVNLRGGFWAKNPPPGLRIRSSED